MIKMEQKFSPDWISPPGDTIADILEERDWTQNEFAKRMEQSPKHINLLLNGKASITEETALKLESVLGSTARFWLNREALYRVSLARIEEQKSLTSWIPWMEQFPIKELMEHNFIEKRRLVSSQKALVVKDLLKFFGVASPEGWKSRYLAMEVAFRRTREEQSDVRAISAWLRKGENISEKTDGPNYDRNKFEKALNSIRSLTNLTAKEFEPELRNLCYESGVVLVIIPSLSRTHVSGVARWVNPHKPLIQLSLYGKTNDRFWFTFFHEAAHILLHDKKTVFLDEFDGNRLPSTEEIEADEWATKFLIPPSTNHLLQFLKTKRSVRNFAHKIGIHPGIVVGRLQHDHLIPHSWMNGLKVSYRLTKSKTS